jgi:GTPase SAR1 family protein
LLGYSALEFLPEQHAFMLVYWITSHASFDALDNWIRRVYEAKGKNALIWLVGNKCDLEEERVVSTQRGEDLACALGCNFSETSARKDVNVDHVFMGLAKTLHKRSQIQAELEKKWQTGRTNLHCCIM